MRALVIRRLIYMVPTLFAISLVAFLVIQLPPGNYLSTYIAELSARGATVDRGQILALEERYGLNEPVHVQYLRWMSGILLHGDFGQSFAYQRDVSALIWDRIALTVVLALVTMLVSWVIAFPIGVYSAVRQRSLGDYAATFVGFIGLATPNFMLALVFVWIAYRYFGESVGGIVSPEFADSAWNLGKVVDVVSNLWAPVLIIGTAGTAVLIRVLRANLLDELRKPYVTTARAKGLPEWRVVLKYPVRMSLSPFISTIGWILPTLIGGEVMVSIVLSLETTGPLLLEALQSQDMYLAGAFILILGALTLIGTLLSDLLLAWWDPRIRHAQAEEA
ncbi:peptide/nickel transport system permease protein [Spinactinospora alkalitolerans]|uniref:Peptide/nickel transport system permease protein n=1 Tax=Spinactinospora alkalitolerans TaxID=687207 RepID=A0A852TZP1_9ACTN|nr:ABC transporter permease [Spinactinospora alkalitolerans]NYE49291.1 peptide/nickel transport system permease protein [Spinactinospora alkalitolerans]